MVKVRYIFILIFLFFTMSISQQITKSGREYRRAGIHNGNLVYTVFGNWGVVGQPADKGPRGAWLYPTNGYVGDVSLMVGAEVNYNDSVKFHSVVICPVDRPTKRAEISPDGKFWGFEPQAGYFNENYDGVAISTNPASWPPYWPDKMNDTEDPGWSGAWNGFFGKNVKNADQESYFVMDDNNDEEFNYANYNNLGVAFKPDPDNPQRNGLGLEVKVRGMQWSQFLAQDCIFWLYEITNTSKYDYPRVSFGMLVGTYVGVTGTDDSPQEYDDDWSFFDVERDLTWTGDYPNDNSRNPKWQGPVGMVGYAFLESPGNPYDGIDNDGDAEDNPKIPSTAPYFSESDFDSILISSGDTIVLIDDNFNRSLFIVPDKDTTVYTRGAYINIKPGVTKLVEGNVILDSKNQEVVNPNAYDGIDNDLDGLIDENFYLHYHQIKKDQYGKILFDMLNPVKYKDYKHNLGVNDPLIDERRDDGIDNDGDWNPEFDDVGADGVPNTGDIGEGDGQPTLGEPNFDKTDVDESDQIGLTSFEYFTPANDINLADDEDLWKRLSPGYFEVPQSIQDNKPLYGEDGDFIYGTGYFPLRAGQTERISLALVFGHDQNDLLKNRETVQKIYNSDYRFPQPPEKPTLTAIPGDGKVILYWDRKAEESVDPVLKVNDFEGYKIYKSTDPEFSDIRVITDADGNASGYKPLVQYDIKNGITGYFRASEDLFQDTRGYSFYLGNDTGLKHTFVDTDVENGRTYYYAVVAYDHGDATKDIFPSENTKFISVLNTGEIVTDINTAAVTPNPKPAGYLHPEDFVELEDHVGPATGSVFLHIVDETKVTGHKYRLEFWDSSTDSVDNDGDWNLLTDDIGNDHDKINIDEDGSQNNGLPDYNEPNVDKNDLDEFAPYTTYYNVLDLNENAVEFTVPNYAVVIDLEYEHIIDSTFRITDLDGNQISSDAYELVSDKGKIKILDTDKLKPGFKYVAYFYYYPVYKSPHIFGNKYDLENEDSDIFDGVELVFNNDWNVVMDVTSSGWNIDCPYLFSLSAPSIQFGPGNILTALRYPSSFEIQFFDDIVDTSANYFNARPIPVNFKIYDITDSEYVDFVFNDRGYKGKLSASDELYLFKKDPDGNPVWIWLLSFKMPQDQEDPGFTFKTGDKLTINVKKPFRKGDIYEFTTEKPYIDKNEAKKDLDSIRVVPNPYVVAHSHEAPLPPGITSGRGERKIDFINVPVDAKIHIFTNNGDHVITLTKDGNQYNGVISWNLKSKDNLDVAAGVYFYVLESNIGKKTGKIAIIK